MGYDLRFDGRFDIAPPLPPDRGARRPAAAEHDTLGEAGSAQQPKAASTARFPDGWGNSSSVGPRAGHVPHLCAPPWWSPCS